MLVIGTAGALFVPPLVCIPCLALFAGLGGGYLAGQFDRPGTGSLSARAGASAGAIGGVGALLAHLISGGVAAFTVGPEGAADLARQLGLDTGGAVNPAVYYGSALGSACCLGLFEIVLLAGLGALGGLLWYQITGKQNTPPSTPATL
jgi:hypothetical protein